MWFQITDRADPADVAAVVDAARVATPRCGDVVVVAVDGPSGSGKTTLARGVADALGCAVVHMDLIYPGWDGLADAVDLLVDQVLEPFARGDRASYRVWDWERDCWGDTRSVGPEPFVVVEGCAASVGAAGRYAALRVWVDAPHEQRRERALARDGATFAPHWQRWADQEQSLFGLDRTRERADLHLWTGAR